MIAVVDYHKGNLMSVERGVEAAGAEALITDDASVIARADGIVLPGVGAFADASATMQELGQLDVIRDRIAAGVPFLGICLGMHLLFEEGVEGAPDEDDEESSHNARGLAVLPGVVTKMPRESADGTVLKVPHVGWNTVVPPACQPAERAAAAAGSGTGSCPSAAAGRTEVQPGFASGQSPTPEPASLTHAQPASLRVASPAAEGGAARSSARAETPSGRFERAQDCLSTVPPSAAVQGEFACPLLEGIPAGTYFYFTHSYIAPSGPFVVGQTTHSVVFPSAVQYGERCFGVQFHPEKSSDAGAAVLRNFVRIVEGA